MDKTYAETHGQTPFDWRLFLTRAIADKITHEEYQGALERARRWVACACGNQCAIIPREQTIINPHRMLHAPLDEELELLGRDFYQDMHAEDYDRALATLTGIEARSAILIAEELAKLNAK